MPVAEIQLQGTYYWSKIADWKPAKGTTSEYVEEHEWSTEVSRGQCQEQVRDVATKTHVGEKIGIEEGASWELVSTKISAEVDLHLDITNAVKSVAKQETKEVVKKIEKLKISHKVEGGSRLVYYQLQFQCPGVTVASVRTIIRDTEDPELEKRVLVPIECQIRPRPFLKSLEVRYGRHETDAPDDIIPVIDDKTPDINHGFSNSLFVWLVPKWGYKSTDSETLTFVHMRETPYKDQDLDLASGAGGKYRYIQYGRNPQIKRKITDIRMLRTNIRADEKWARALGYTGISNDFNANRGQDYIYLIWKTADLDDSIIA